MNVYMKPTNVLNFMNMRVKINNSKTNNLIVYGLYHGKLQENALVCIQYMNRSESGRGIVSSI